jgi:glyoxylase-like metal-dependent hydrolase (beta-lactamase superfamily II)
MIRSVHVGLTSGISRTPIILSLLRGHIDSFSESSKLHVNGTTLALDHYASAHTDSDISVRLEETDVVHVGDTYWNGIYPLIDYSTGGNIKGSIPAAD